MADIRVVFIHGNGGSTTGKSYWFPWAQAVLEEHGIASAAPDMPDPVLAREKYWIPFLEDEMKVDENTVLVGHSSGAIAAMRFAENHKILGSVLIGTYYTDLGMDDEKESGYFDRPWDWDVMRANQQWSAIFASIDDPFIPIEEPRYVHDHLGSEYFEFTDRGHFAEGDNNKEFSELIDYLVSRILVRK